MSLQLVLGNSGSGKTTFMYKKIIKEANENINKNYLIIVPEQFTMATQKEIVEATNNKAIMNIDVLSFDRLAYRIFDELGINNIRILEDTGKSLVLRKVAQEEKKNLTVFAPNINKIGYIEKIKSILSEFMQYQVTPDTLENLISRMENESVLKSKLSDILVLYNGFYRYLEGKYITTEDVLSKLMYNADKSEILKNSEIFLDCYTGFTPSQNKLIGKLLKIVDKITVSFTIDSKEDYLHTSGIQDLFNMPKKSISKLLNMARENNINVEETILLGIEDNNKNRFINSNELRFLEQNLFRHHSHKFSSSDGNLEPKQEQNIVIQENEDISQEQKELNSQIKMFVCQSPRSELANACCIINKLVRNEGYRYKDFAIVTGDVEVYSNYVEEVLGKYEIPYFIDQTKKILFQPFIELIRAAIEVVKTNYSYEAVFRFLRCGFSDLSTKDIDVLDNYALATGVNNASKWKKRWAYMPKNSITVDENDEKLYFNYKLSELNDIRKYIYNLFLPLKECFLKKNKNNIKEQLTELFKLCDTLSVEEKLKNKAKEYEDAGDLVRAKEYGQIYNIVIDLFEKIADLLGDEIVTTKEFEEILDAGFESANVATIPAKADGVIIGDIERTRLNNVKCLIFIGVNDGIIPVSASSGGIISQFERSVLEDEFEMELAPSTRDQFFIQKYYLYLNITKPTDKLYISYHTNDAESNPVRPSYFVATIKKMFPELEEIAMSDEKINKEFSTMKTAIEFLVHNQDYEDTTWLTLCKSLMDENDIMDSFFRAKFYRYFNEPISKLVAEALYGKKISMSVTRLEKFVACAYSHFLKYGLLLKEREKAEFRSLDIGNIYHDALKRYGDKIEESDFSWRSISDEMRNKWSDLSLEEAVLNYEDIGIFDSAENRHVVDRMKRVLRQTIWALTYQIKSGKFEPKDLEISFSQTDDIDAINFALSEEKRIRLNGKIDRIDVAQNDDKIYVKVIDYKSGKQKFDLVKIYEGLQLQLVVYLSSAMEINAKKYDNFQVIPGGILYYNIDDPRIEINESEIDLSNKEEASKALEDDILKALKPNGLLNDDKDVIESFDLNCESGSKVAPFSYKKDGNLSSTSSATSQENLEVLCEYVKNFINVNSQDILNGKIEVNPIDADSKTSPSCSYCPFSSICGYDKSIIGFKSRNLTKMKNDEIYEKMKVDIEQMKYDSKKFLEQEKGLMLAEESKVLENKTSENKEPENKEPENKEPENKEKEGDN
ncbi:PD-(D/E)XK nuclease family protein [Lachnobacterium bovis]|uniref:DNA helicase/exodeoxyribonuclease V, subunit B n=1 Tax=Lachnobacterium bovis TaxID=140626 RepID=A0A1H9RD15_9FIRM|nr:PD-(D/E)XK nuclease family protein [Lachnobacterium bovis]SER70626.1 DNA helicase/exodeoxyribonuclease V, subunit B [Lachnobacterium bovis]